MSPLSRIGAILIGNGVFFGELHMDPRVQPHREDCLLCKEEFTRSSVFDFYTAYPSSAYRVGQAINCLLEKD
ncbi:hypothetical protein EYZ11_000931 [Aspergillus tanneri]|uniref:Uncharacterized protein n=1 Tax=Aspergillus tanneri TaxID=1220188 RepID=A0A4S3JVT6_9EURO|nr:hypothetical protein EYZ11_000931 [Aspergillus tanneri]